MNACTAEWDVNDGEENLMRECLIEGVKTAAAVQQR